AFISSEIHKAFGPLWNPKTPEATRQNQIGLLTKRFDYVTELLKNKQYLMGDQFTIADAYLFTIASWSTHHKIDLGNWPALQNFMTRVAARPKVQEALKVEGLAQ